MARHSFFNSLSDFAVAIPGEAKPTKKLTELLIIHGMKPPKLQAISKMRLTPHGGVARRLKMLTYYPCMLRFFAAPRLALNPDPLF
jgi:hypothetical protein